MEHTRQRKEHERIAKVTPEMVATVKRMAIKYDAHSINSRLKEDEKKFGFKLGQSTIEKIIRGGYDVKESKEKSEELSIFDIHDIDVEIIKGGFNDIILHQGDQEIFLFPDDVKKIINIYIDGISEWEQID